MSDLNLNNPPPNSPTATSELTELKSACGEVQRETFNLKVILLIVVGALTLFFWREASYQNFDVTQMQPQVTQASQVVEALKKQDSSLEKQLQILRGAASRLGEYGKLHPDYAQILAKYGVMVIPPGPAAATAKPPTTAPLTPKK